MSLLNNNQNGFENRMNPDHIKFRVQSRAVKQFGFWAAEKLELSGDDAECYARQVVEADFEEPGVEDVFRKVEADFIKHKSTYTRSEMEKVFKEKYSAAEASVAHEMNI